MKLSPVTIVIASICCLGVAFIEYHTAGRNTAYAEGRAMGGVIGTILIGTLVALPTYFIAKRSSKAGNIAFSIVVILALLGQVGTFSQAEIIRNQQDLAAILQQANQQLPKRLSDRLEFTSVSYQPDVKVVYYDYTVLGSDPFPKSPEESRAVTGDAQGAWASYDPRFQHLITTMKASVQWRYQQNGTYVFTANVH